MRKRLSPLGPDLALILDQPLVGQLGIDATTELEPSIEDGRLILEIAPPLPADAHRRRVAAATQRALATHRLLLQRLAQ